MGCFFLEEDLFLWTWTFFLLPFQLGFSMYLKRVVVSDKDNLLHVWVEEEDVERKHLLY